VDGCSEQGAGMCVQQKGIEKMLEARGSRSRTSDVVPAMGAAIEGDMASRKRARPGEEPAGMEGGQSGSFRKRAGAWPSRSP
jgi:hypothetical protein